MTNKIVSKTVNLVSWKVDTASYNKVVKKIKSIKKLTEDCGKSFSKMVGGNGVNQWAKTVENVQKKQAALAQKQAAGARQTAEQMRKAEISQRRMAEYEKRVAQQRARGVPSGMVGKSAGHNAALYAAQNEQMRRGHAALPKQPKGEKQFDVNPDNPKRHRMVMTGYASSASDEEKEAAKAAHSARMRRARMYNSIDNLESMFGKNGRFSHLGESAQRAAYNRLQKLADASYKSEDGLSDFNRVLRQTTNQLARMNAMAKAKGKGVYSENGVPMSRAQARRTAILNNGGGRKTMAGRAGLGGLGLGVMARGLLPAMGVGMAVSGIQNTLQAGIAKTQEDRKLKAFNTDPTKFWAYQQAVAQKNGFNLSATKFSDMSKDVYDKAGDLSHGTFKQDKKTGEYKFGGGGEFSDIINMVMKKTKGTNAQKKAAGEQVLANLQKLENAQDFAAYIDKLGQAANLTRAEMTQLAETVNDGSWLLGVSTKDIQTNFQRLKDAGLVLSEQERKNVEGLQALGAEFVRGGSVLAQFAASAFFEGLGLKVEDVTEVMGKLKEPVQMAFRNFGTLLNSMSPLLGVFESWWDVGKRVFGVFNRLLEPLGGFGTLLKNAMGDIASVIAFIPNTIGSVGKWLHEKFGILEEFKDFEKITFTPTTPAAQTAQEIVQNTPQASMQTSAQQRPIVNPLQVRVDQQTKVTIQPDGNGISNCFKGIAETVCKENHDRMIELISGPTMESTTA